MAPPSVNLELYKDEIIDLLFQGKTISDIVQHLRETYEVQLVSRTLQRRMRTWQVTVRPQTQDTELLRTRIQDLFFDGFDDTELLQILQEEDHQIGKYSLKRIRKELGLKRRLRTEEDKETANQRALDALTEELQHGVVEGYGRGLLYAHFQQLGVHIARFVSSYDLFFTNINRNRLFSIYRSTSSV